jgi:hypothetical protein
MVFVFALDPAEAALDAGAAAGEAVPGNWRRTMSGKVARCLNSGSLGK